MNWLRHACLASLLTLLSACGGGGGGCDAQVALGGVANCSSTPAEPTYSYTTVATPGDMLSLSFTPTTGQLSYVITHSIHNLAGISRQLAVVRNPTDNSYANSNYAGKFSFHPSGLMMGLIQENFGTGVALAPTLGLQNVEKDLTLASDIYNIVTTQCNGSNVCVSNHGTLKINANNTWDWCIGGDLSNVTPACTSPLETGLLIQDANSGKMTLMLNTLAPVAHAIAQVRNGQKVLLIELIERTSNLQAGMAVGVAKSNAPNSLNGSWRFMDATQTGLVTIAGLQATSFADGVSGSTSYSLLGNTPWTGMTTVKNGPAVVGWMLISDSGILAFANQASSPNRLTVGLKQ